MYLVHRCRVTWNHGSVFLMLILTTKLRWTYHQQILLKIQAIISTRSLAGNKMYILNLKIVSVLEYMHVLNICVSLKQCSSTSIMYSVSINSVSINPSEQHDTILGYDSSKPAVTDSIYAQINLSTYFLTNELFLSHLWVIIILTILANSNN